MKILVVGTSNTLVRGGWFDGFVSGIDFDVERIALGGAPFTQFFSVLHKVKESDAGHIVLECAANDESYAQHIGNDIFVDRLFFMLLSSLRSIAPTTVLRIPPELTLLDQPNVFKRQQVICNQLNCDVYDAAAAIIDLAKGSRPYRDKHHPTTQIAFEIGQLFSRYLQPRLSSVNKQPDNPACFINSVSNVGVQGTDLESTRIETSLLQEEFCLLKPGSSVNLKKNVFALGFYINSGRSTGVLRLQGAADYQDIFCYYTSPSHKNVKRFVPLRNGMNLRRMSCVYAHNSIHMSLHTDLFMIEQEVSLGSILCVDLNTQPKKK